MIFYDHIKGCGSFANDSDGQWTWLQFKNGSDWWDNPNHLSGLINNPHLILRHGNNNTDPINYAKALIAGSAEAIDAGRIITSSMPGQVIDQPLEFQTTIDIRNTSNNSSASEETFINSDEFKGIRFFNESGNYNNLDFYLYDFPNVGLKIASRASAGSNIFTWLIFSSRTISLCTSTHIIGELAVDNQVNALYFNATSDRRAKTNLKAADSATALEIVNKLPIYTFNYKSDMDETSIGVLAQDAALFDGALNENFSMVTNREATGKDGDYMQIKESKMVYVLWAAVQQQQKQIKHLEARIEQLEK